MRGCLLRVVDQHAEMVHAGVIHALADLVGLEFEHGDVERAVAEEISGGKRALRAGLADLLEAERLFVELRSGLGVVGRDRDMAKLGHETILSRKRSGVGARRAHAGMMMEGIMQERGTSRTE